MTEPWADWIPGVLSDVQLKDLCDKDKILGVSRSDGKKPYPTIDCSSIDLTLDDECYVLPSGAVKPCGKDYLHYIIEDGLAKKLEHTGGVYTLEARTTYVFKLKERISALRNSGISGQATGKSSIGRLDVLTRLIVDGMDCYESFTLGGLAKGNGDMYLEVTPMTFPVEVKKGNRLTQLRLFFDEPKASEINSEVLYKSVLHGGVANDGSLSVDLSRIDIGGNATVAYCAREDRKHTAIRLWDKPGSLDPAQYWSLKNVEAHDRLTIQKTDFYIIRSLERISLPGGIAVYCRANDETIGEMRIHYAGFIHPFFGKNRRDKQKGTPVTFEVRGHDVNVSMKHGEKMARLTFYRMSQDCQEEGDNTYNQQTLKLSNIFAPWPKEFEIDGNGNVVALPEGQE